MLHLTDTYPKKLTKENNQQTYNMCGGNNSLMYQLVISLGFASFIAFEALPFGFVSMEVRGSQTLLDRGPLMEQKKF